jgi:hypothetical protein
VAVSNDVSIGSEEVENGWRLFPGQRYLLTDVPLKTPPNTLRKKKCSDPTSIAVCG